MMSSGITSASFGVAWVALVAFCAWLAMLTNSAVAWFVCALAVGLPALTCMVMAHSPAKSIAQIIRDAEASA